MDHLNRYPAALNRLALHVCFEYWRVAAWFSNKCVMAWQLTGLVLLAGNVHKIGNFLLANEFIEAVKSSKVCVETLVIGR